MHSDRSASPSDASSFDDGLISPVTAGHEAAVADRALLEALVATERALIEAYAAVGAFDQLPPAQRTAVLDEARELRADDVRGIALDGVAGGNPVIPLVKRLRADAGLIVRPWVHRGATSQDILDTALMVVAKAAAGTVIGRLDETLDALDRFARGHRDQVAAARTLTQHAVPTTSGLRAANWARAVRRARLRLAAARDALPAQLGGAGGTLASFVELIGEDRASRLPAALAEATGLAAPDAPWHTARWPVTELGDALVQALDALGVLAADVATLSRTEIGELAEATGGGSSAMPQKQNPARSVLIRSAALRAPHLAATLHTAAALAVDERPDGAWHVEWPTLRELLRLALGAAAHAADLAEGLRADSAAAARNLDATRGLIVSERLSIVLGPILGADKVAEIVRSAGLGGDLGLLVHNALAAANTAVPAGIDDLLDPAAYTGLAGRLVDGDLGDAPHVEIVDPTAPAADERPGPYDPFDDGSRLPEPAPRRAGFDPFGDPFQADPPRTPASRREDDR
ncbi:lyase family protein [Microbacterium marinilacus]|uniref:3-carboxy-cis,cis-muconate cycloisomerase n=1 Tax=Microbacterium marinilacus TaxID=415209 RepID=A0ABP7BY36_9MICO|nr:lyase family protein [Microbacterium marinilacus]MBY0688135.1 adenylosuccinate lyase [Microbacterium marinilacus]